MPSYVKISILVNVPWFKYISIFVQENKNTENVYFAVYSILHVFKTFNNTETLNILHTWKSSIFKSQKKLYLLLLSRRLTKLTCFFFLLTSFTLLLRNLVRFSSFLYLCLFIFLRRICSTFLQFSGVELSPFSSNGTANGGSTMDFPTISPSSRGGEASSNGGRE